MERVNVNQQHKDSLSKQERIGLLLGGLMGTMYAFYILAAINFGWMTWQTFFDKKPFDPYPFSFLLFCGNILQLLWLPILNVYQSVLSKHAELKADSDLQTDIRSEEMLKSINGKLDTLIENKNVHRPNETTHI